MADRYARQPDQGPPGLFEAFPALALEPGLRWFLQIAHSMSDNRP